MSTRAHRAGPIVLLLLIAGLSAPIIFFQQNVDAAESDPYVELNTRSHIFHHPECNSARACTRNCVHVRRSEALQRGGVPCKHCGGGLRLEGARYDLRSGARGRTPRLP